MIKTSIFNKSANRQIVDHKGCFQVIEHDRDLSVYPDSAERAYYASQMNVHRRQVLANLAGNAVIVQSGAMQMMLGNLDAATDVKGAGDLFKKAFAGKVTGESAIKPKYSGNGVLVLEPTYKHLLLEDLSEWNGSVVIDDGLFLACESTVNISTVARSNLSSALAGGEGLFNTCLSGNGVAVLESPVPREELIEIQMDNDVVKIDGNFAIAWSNTLQFTVEKTTKTLIGSAASGEGFVNVYRGSGKILVAPVT